METKTMTVADIRERMQQEGITQRELSQRTGIAVPNICAILRGRTYCGPTRLQRLAVAVSEATPPGTEF